MTFSEVQFQETINKINGNLAVLSGKIAAIPPTVRAAMDHWYIPGFVKDAIERLAQMVTELATWTGDKIREVLKGVAAPVYFFRYAFEWQDIRGIANDVTGELKPEVLRASTVWTGPAAAAYGRVIGPQGAAANKIATISDRIATTMQICAGVGLTFYVAVAVILVKFIAAMVTAITALGSAVFSWAGAALIVEEAGVNSSLIWAAIGALTAALATQAQQLIGLHGEAIDNSVFPGGHWPDPTTASYRDGTVRDGDADWSLER